MKIKQQLSVVAIVVAAWMLCALAYAAGLLHGELLMLVIAATGTLSMVIALIVVASAAARWIVKEQRAELSGQRAELAAHSARMQQIGAEIKVGMRETACEVADRVITMEKWTTAKARGTALAYIDAARDVEASVETDRWAPDREFWHGGDTGPFPMASSGN